MKHFIFHKHKKIYWTIGALIFIKQLGSGATYREKDGTRFSPRFFLVQFSIALFAYHFSLEVWF